MAKGKITKKLLNLIGIKFCVLRKKSDLKKFELLIKFSKKNNKSVACLIERSNNSKKLLKLKKYQIVFK